MARPQKTRYKVKNESKYSGKVDNIICRSSWETFVCRHLDNNKNVRKWASEEIVIPYYFEVDATMHRYYIDFFVETMDSKKFIIEVKPHSETLPPKPPKNKGKKALATYQEKMITYIRNMSKWDAAKKWAKENDMTFLIWTENELKQLGRFTQI